MIIVFYAIISVGPKNLWPWSTFTLGPKAPAEEGYSRGHLIKVQVTLRHSQGWFCPRHPRGPLEKKGKNGIGTVLGKPKISALIEKGPLDSMATKDKGKAIITAIEYSASDRTMLFSFYNHPQPLWVWADGTSINPGKSNLHVDVGWRVQANIKREVSNLGKGAGKKRLRTKVSQAVPRRETSQANIIYFHMNTTTNHCPVTKA